MPYSGKEGKRKAYFEINGTYKLNEVGKYYTLNKRIVHTKITSVESYPSFVGWGEIDERFNVYDLLIIHSTNNCKHSFQVHLFIGMAKVNYLVSVCNYLLTFLNNKSPKNGLLKG
ncbi:hypothetical protein AEM51_13080 [Bacteroidetes bacterium UKL13-3]|nr:hypothetical protein AEM51_13080 [Bacteroidetes bacterium UKL13-3]HCP93136.1 hypothetical protein [Bacteroidota bacterium]